MPTSARAWPIHPGACHPKTREVDVATLETVLRGLTCSGGHQSHDGRARSHQRPANVTFALLTTILKPSLGETANSMGPSRARCWSTSSIRSMRWPS